ncbi:MAG: ATP-binding cassette domain-containing protein [Verrucomicrobia bacterium]|nr:ATP-binding cassette domain-containing protein [Verrucomicrobiota bacterium]
MIEISRLCKSFKGVPVLQGVDLEAAESERLVIIGGSGCGKSVLLRHIAGLLKPDSGSVKIDGQELTTLSERELNPIRKKIGVLFQGAALFDSLDVFHNVAFSLLEERSVNESEIRDRVEEALDVVGMNGQEHKKPGELSGGMRKRVGLARAIIHRPRIMLYDEPTTGLDPQIADSINRLILKMSNHFHVTSMVVTHDMVSAYLVGSRIAMLHQGKILVSGSPDEIQRNINPVVQHFIRGISEERDQELFGTNGNPSGATQVAKD